MPYVAQDSKEFVRNVLNEYEVLHTIRDVEAGELNYIITNIILKYWEAKPSYGRLATLTGVLRNVEGEFYRRVAVPYENAKKAQNGDVYPYVKDAG